MEIHTYTLAKRAVVGTYIPPNIYTNVLKSKKNNYLYLWLKFWKYTLIYLKKCINKTESHVE